MSDLVLGDLGNCRTRLQTSMGTTFQVLEILLRPKVAGVELSHGNSLQGAPHSIYPLDNHAV